MEVTDVHDLCLQTVRVCVWGGGVNERDLQRECREGWSDSLAEEA